MPIGSLRGRLSRSGPVALVLAGLAAGGPAVAASADPAKDAVAAEMARRGLAERVVGIEIVSDSSTGTPRYRTAWVRLSGCSGHIVVSLSQASAVRDVYATGDCTLPAQR